MSVSKCVYSETSIVNFVSLRGVYFSRANCPIGLNAQLSCSRFALPLFRLTWCSEEPHQSTVHCSAVSVISDMLCVKSEQMISGFKRRDIDFMLESMCIS